MGKRSKWQAFLTVSASGPEFSPLLEEMGHLRRTRMAADLRYTTADVDFLESHFKEVGGSTCTCQWHPQGSGREGKGEHQGQHLEKLQEE
jgi:hypothetical protein